MAKKTKTLICFYCDGEMIKATKDHIIPRMLGGSNHEKNKVKCHVECNSIKANYLPKHLAEIIQEYHIPRATTEERKIWLQKIYLKCIDLEINHIPKYKDLMIKKPHKG